MLNQLHQAFATFLGVRFEANGKIQGCWAHHRKSLARKTCRIACVGEIVIPVHTSAQSEDLLLVFFDIEKGAETYTHKCQIRCFHAVGFAQRRYLLRIRDKNLQFAMGCTSQGAEICVLDSKPAGAHDIFPEDELLKQWRIGTKHM